MTSRLIAIGVFGAPHGVRGELRAKAYTADPRSLAAYGALYDSSGVRSFKILALRPLKDDMVVLRVDGVADRDAAAKLTGVELFARRENMPGPEEEEYYHADLVGLSAATRAGEDLGRVVAVNNYGAGDVLEIAPVGGGETLLLPFTKAVAPEIDIAGGRIVIVLPEEIDGEEERSER
jgi:16S rRNA processing protein RimM